MKIVASSLFHADPTGNQPCRPLWEAVRASDASLKESWFRDAIAANPDLVIDPIRRAALIDDEAWFTWGVEVSTSVGPIDVLLVSQSGRVGIIETKLSYNPERRRQVVAQVLDYAIHLMEVDVATLPTLPATGPTVDDVQNHLDDGDHLVVIAGDELDERALRLGRAVLGDHLVNPWDLVMVDLALYRTIESATPAYLVVPHLRGQVAAETRQVVKVDLVEKTVKVERMAPTASKAAARSIWDEARFFEDAERNLGSEDLASVRDFVDSCRSVGLNPEIGSGKKRGSFNVKDPTLSTKSFVSVFSDGNLRLNLGWLNDNDRMRELRGKLVAAARRELQLDLPETGDQRWPEFGVTSWSGKGKKMADILARITAEVRPR